MASKLRQAHAENANVLTVPLPPPLVLFSEWCSLWWPSTVSPNPQALLSLSLCFQIPYKDHSIRPSFAWPYVLLKNYWQAGIMPLGLPKISSISMQVQKLYDSTGGEAMSINLIDRSHSGVITRGAQVVVLQETSSPWNCKLGLKPSPCCHSISRSGWQVAEVPTNLLQYQPDWSLWESVWACRWWMAWASDGIHGDSQAARHREVFSLLMAVI